MTSGGVSFVGYTYLSSLLAVKFFGRCNLQEGAKQHNVSELVTLTYQHGLSFGVSQTS